MQLSRSRYVTVCQQLLVAGAVLVLGLSAVGVHTLDIVAPDAHTPGLPADSRACDLAQVAGAARRWPAQTPGGAAIDCRRAVGPAPTTHR